MEYTGKYHQPIARYLREARIFVSVVNAYCYMTMAEPHCDESKLIRRM